MRDLVHNDMQIGEKICFYFQTNILVYVVIPSDNSKDYQVVYIPMDLILIYIIY